MTECQKDPIGYYSFWPILGSPFHRVRLNRQLGQPHSRARCAPSLMACVLVCRTFVHMFSFNCLCCPYWRLVAFVYVKDPLCNRILYLESNLPAGFALALVSMLIIVTSWSSRPRTSATVGGLSVAMQRGLSVRRRPRTSVRILRHHRVASPPSTGASWNGSGQPDVRRCTMVHPPCTRSTPGVAQVHVEQGVVEHSPDHGPPHVFTQRD